MVWTNCLLYQNCKATEPLPDELPMVAEIEWMT
jgi:hypothetical protein